MTRSLEQGNGPAQSATRDLIEDLDPDWIILAGICGGMPADEYTIGDVLVATRIQDLRLKALIEGKPDEYAVVGAPAHKAVATLAVHLSALEKSLGNWSLSTHVGTLRPTLNPANVDLYGSAEWRSKVHRSLDVHFKASNRDYPIHYAGTIGSSDNLMKDSQTAEEIRTFSRQLLGYEMEAAGVFEGASLMDRSYPVIVVRGISDIIGLKRESVWTPYACNTAASFTLALVCSGLLKTRTFDPSSAIAVASL